MFDRDLGTILCEKCPNTHQEKLRIWTLFMQYDQQNTGKYYSEKGYNKEEQYYLTKRCILWTGNLCSTL